MPVRIGDENYYSHSEISEKFKLNIITLRRYHRKGTLVSRKLGKDFYVSEENFRKFINNESKPK